MTCNFKIMGETRLIWIFSFYGCLIVLHNRGRERQSIEFDCNNETDTDTGVG